MRLCFKAVFRRPDKARCWRLCIVGAIHNKVAEYCGRLATFNPRIDGIFTRGKPAEIYLGFLFDKFDIVEHYSAVAEGCESQLATLYRLIVGENRDGQQHIRSGEDVISVIGCVIFYIGPCPDCENGFGTLRLSTFRCGCGFKNIGIESTRPWIHIVVVIVVVIVIKPLLGQYRRETPLLIGGYRKRIDEIAFARHSPPTPFFFAEREFHRDVFEWQL